ncbi:MAG: Gfo/Idh/MocA family protein, partial [Gemmatimonadaceae bacterium]
MAPSRVALIGLGNAGFAIHLPALAGIRGASIVGACDVDLQRRERAAAKWRVPVFADLDHMLGETRPDVVVIGTPPTLHAEQCLRSFAASADVICEKPFASSVAEAETVLQVARDAGRRIALNHEFREMPIFRAVLDAAAASQGAPPVFVQLWQLMDLPPWAEPGWRRQLLQGTLYEAGVHLVDYAMAIFREKPHAVSATISTCGVREEHSDAVALVTLEFSDGRLAQIVQNRLCKGETQYFEVRVDTRESSLRASFGGRARI